MNRGGPFIVSFPSRLLYGNPAKVTYFSPLVCVWQCVVVLCVFVFVSLVAACVLVRGGRYVIPFLSCYTHAVLSLFVFVFLQPPMASMPCNCFKISNPILHTLVLLITTQCQSDKASRADCKQTFHGSLTSQNWNVVPTMPNIMNHGEVNCKDVLVNKFAIQKNHDIAVRLQLYFELRPTSQIWNVVHTKKITRLGSPHSKSHSFFCLDKEFGLREHNELRTLVQIQIRHEHRTGRSYETYDMHSSKCNSPKSNCGDPIEG